MVHHYLEFERPIAELEGKIEELSRLSETAGAGSFDSEIDALRTRLGQLRRESYAALTPWQKAQVARHPERPHFVNYLDGLIEEFVELRGDRKFADDQAIMGGLGRFRGMPVMVIGQEKGHDTTTRLKHNFGMARPEGYRKAVRLMDMAEQFNLPVLTFVDTAGAYPGLGAEERGQAEAIARGTERCLTLKTPMIATVTGEGMSGGAIGIAAGNKVLILEHGIYCLDPVARRRAGQGRGRADAHHRPGPDQDRRRGSDHRRAGRRRPFGPRDHGPGRRRRDRGGAAGPLRADPGPAAEAARRPLLRHRSPGPVLTSQAKSSASFSRLRSKAF